MLGVGSADCDLLVVEVHGQLRGFRFKVALQLRVLSSYSVLCPGPFPFSCPLPGFLRKSAQHLSCNFPLLLQVPRRRPCFLASTSIFLFAEILGFSSVFRFVLAAFPCLPAAAKVVNCFGHCRCRWRCGCLDNATKSFTQREIIIKEQKR